MVKKHDNWAAKNAQVQLNIWVPKVERDDFKRRCKELGISRREMIRRMVAAFQRANVATSSDGVLNIDLPLIQIGSQEQK